jgi:ribosomal protein S16
MRGVGDQEELDKIEDAIDDLGNPADIANTRLKAADLKLKQKKISIASAETIARIHGAFDPKGTGAEDSASIVKRIVQGMKKSGVKPSDLAEMLAKKTDVIDVESEPVSE